MNNHHDSIMYATTDAITRDALMDVLNLMRIPYSYEPAWGEEDSEDETVYTFWVRGEQLLRAIADERLTPKRQR